ncbi:septum formation family protein [Microbacterium sp.]|uniref:septum formation family protein n=1 Tax=Microbacterium sp. TaxID=51671 RepID=UPI003A92722E
MAIVGSALVLSLALSGCSMLADIIGDDSDPQRNADNQVTEDARIDIFSLSVSDCIPAFDSAGDITQIDVVPCADPHSDEVFFEFELTTDHLPAEEEMLTEIEAQCVPAFAEFVGTDYFESALALRWITPTEDTWTQANDRLVQCMIYEPDPKDTTGMTALDVTGSFKGSAR